MEKKRRRRSLQERIADQERELAELRAQARIENLEEILKNGKVAAGSRTEFGSRLRELRLINKVVIAAERHDEPKLVESLKEFQDKIVESMTGLVEEEGPSTV